MDMLRVGVLNMLNGICFFMVFIYINTYWSEQLFYSRTQALAINTSNMMLMVLAIPLAAGIADQIGARNMIIKAVIAGIIGMVPSYWLMTQPELWKAVVGQLAFGLLLAAIYGSGAILSARLLPPPPLSEDGLGVRLQHCPGVSGQPVTSDCYLACQHHPDSIFPGTLSVSDLSGWPNAASETADQPG